MSFDTRMINRAQHLLKKYGRSMILKRTVSGAYDPTTGGTAADTVTTYDCFGLIQYITRTSANQFYGTTTLKETLIQKDDEMCFIAAKGLAIVPKHPIDRLVVDSLEYNVMFTTTLKAGISDVIHVLQIRK